MKRSVLVLMSCVVCLWCGPVTAQETATDRTPQITEKLKADAAKLEPLVSTKFAKTFLAGTEKLLEPTTRIIYRNADRSASISQQEFTQLSAEQQANWTARECTATFYHETGYGSPLVYSRLLDLVSPHWDDAKPHKLLDFGYGSIGHLQLLAHQGFEAHGVDVETMFAALYSEPSDQGVIGSGSVTIHTGQWPANAELKANVGGDYALITSKNTLKAGYIHPNPPDGQTVDPKRLVHLGVDDETFLQHIHASLAPGGLFVIYNICPPQNAADKPYLPHADGKSPFSREHFERAGFEVLAFDTEDRDWVADAFMALGYSADKTREQARQDLFCWYTIVRKLPKK